MINLKKETRRKREQRRKRGEIKGRTRILEKMNDNRNVMICVT